MPGAAGADAAKRAADLSDLRGAAQAGGETAGAAAVTYRRGKSYRRLVGEEVLATIAVTLGLLAIYWWLMK
jgi:hypothetical protein